MTKERAPAGELTCAAAELFATFSRLRDTTEPDAPHDVSGDARPDVSSDMSGDASSDAVFPLPLFAVMVSRASVPFERVRGRR